MVTRTHDVVDSPLGPITLVAEDDRLAGLYFAERRRGPGDGSCGDRRPGTLVAVAEQLDAYFAGERTTFDHLDLAPNGTAFQRQVWTELLQVPYGTTASYADIAERIGKPSAVRAVGAANGRNPTSIVVPCHRVVGTDGSLTGYGGGLHRKEALLTLERALPPHATIAPCQGTLPLS